MSIRDELLKTYAPKVKRKSGLSKPLLEDATNRKPASQSVINRALNGHNDRDTLLESLIVQYGGEDLIPLRILLDLFPEDD